jgi:GntR family transcriptional regulator/MocR family aminotransferase
MAPAPLSTPSSSARLSFAGLSLDRASALPLHLQIVAHLRAAILQGTIAAGTRLLGSREVARELGCSRTVVLTAFDLLSAEGYLVATPRGGVVVAELTAAVAARRAPPAAMPTDDGLPGALSSRWDALLASAYDTNWQSPFSPGAPDVGTFPFAEWGRLLRQAWQQPSETECLDLPPEGPPELRREIATYLAAVRGVVCAPDEVVVTSGTSGALDMLARMILDPGDEVWVEEPGFVEARWALTAAGARLVPVPVDDRGLVVAEGVARAPRARLVVVTPSHQYPLGVAMALERRLELLDWASRTGAWIIEDDYNSEFRHDDRMTAALRSLDRDNRVIYLGTFSKIMLPGLRLGYMVADPRVVKRFARGRGRLDVSTSGIGQQALARFLHEGHLLRHLKRMRKVYAARRAALMAAIAAELPDDLAVPAPGTGLHLVALFTPRLAARMTDVAAAQALRAAGLHVQPLSQNFIGAPTRQGLVLGYGRLPEAQARPLIAQLARCLQSGFGAADR